MKDVGGTNCLGLFRMASLPTRRSPPHASTALLLAEAHVTRQCFAVILRDNYDQRSRDIRILYGVVRARRAISIRLVATRSEEHTSELQSLMRISYALFCMQKQKQK